MRTRRSWIRGEGRKVKADASRPTREVLSWSQKKVRVLLQTQDGSHPLSVLVLEMQNDIDFSSSRISSLKVVNDFHTM